MCFVVSSFWMDFAYLDIVHKPCFPMQSMTSIRLFCPRKVGVIYWGRSWWFGYLGCFKMCFLCWSTWGMVFAIVKKMLKVCYQKKLIMSGDHWCFLGAFFLIKKRYIGFRISDLFFQLGLLVLWKDEPVEQCRHGTSPFFHGKYQQHARF